MLDPTFMMCWIRLLRAQTSFLNIFEAQPAQRTNNARAISVAAAGRRRVLVGVALDPLDADAERVEVLAAGGVVSTGIVIELGVGAAVLGLERDVQPDGLLHNKGKAPVLRAVLRGSERTRKGIEYT